MIIKGINNQTVEFRITNYEFPNITDEFYDSNWLMIYLNVQSELGNWETVHPSLLTWEVQELIDWFKQLARNEQPEWLEQGFIEPNLSFYLLNSYEDTEKKFKIRFEAESKPISAVGSKEYFVEFHASNSKLIDIANGFRDELAKYPERK